MALALAGCPGDDADATGDSEDTPGTSSGGAMSTDSTGPDVDGSTGATQGSASSDGADGTTSTDGGADTTGEPPTGEGRARLLILETDDEETPVQLSLIDYDQGVLDATPVHEPPRDGEITTWGISPGGGWIFYRVSRRESDDLYVAAYADGQAQAPVLVDADPVPADANVGTANFLDDDSALVFFSVSEGDGGDATQWLVTLDGAPSAPVSITAPLGDGELLGSAVELGPPGAGALLEADFEGTGAIDLHLATLDPGDVPSTTRLSEHALPEQDVAFASARMAADGSFCIYRADANIDGVNELFWVGLGEVPTAAMMLNPALTEDGSLLANRVAPDGRWVSWWQGEDVPGEVYMAATDGETPAAAQIISGPGANEAYPAPSVFSADGEYYAYTAEHDIAGNRDAYLVDVSAAVPGTPERINGALIPGGEVDTIVFGPAVEYVYYAAFQDQLARELYRAPIVDGVPGIPQKVSGDLVDNGQVSGEMLFSGDGTLLAYSANQDVPGRQELYLVELGARVAESVRVNPDLPGVDEVQFGVRFSDDDSAIVYQTRGNAGPRTLWLEDRTDGLENPVMVSERVFGYRPLPTR